MISSLTRFISTSSFSISTLTDLLTTGLLEDLVVAPDLLAAAGALLLSATATADESDFLATEVSSASPVLGTFVIFVANTCLISDTFSTAFLTVSISFSVITTIVNSNSNLSSSISCAEGSDLIISPNSSTALNTRNALAAFKIQFSSTCTSRLYTFKFLLNASFTAFDSYSLSLTSLA